MCIDKFLKYVHLSDWSRWVRTLMCPLRCTLTQYGCQRCLVARTAEDDTPRHLRENACSTNSMLRSLDRFCEHFTFITKCLWTSTVCKSLIRLKQRMRICLNPRTKRRNSMCDYSIFLIWKYGPRPCRRRTCTFNSATRVLEFHGWQINWPQKTCGFKNIKNLQHWWVIWRPVFHFLSKGV